MQTYQRIKLDGLRNHPLNAKVFGELAPDRRESDQELIESIARKGVVTPILVADCNGRRIIMSGHRRRQAAARAGLTEIPALVHDDVDPLAIDEMWAEANVQREMDNEMRARWYTFRKKIEKEAAKARRKAGLSPVGENFPHGEVGENCPQGEVGENFPQGKAGRARDLAAAEVGWSGKTADAAAEVVEEIDRAESEGDSERASDLRETLNSKSVSAAKAKIRASEPLTPDELADRARRILKDLIDRAVRAADDLHEAKPQRTKRDEIVSLLQGASGLVW